MKLGPDRRVRKRPEFQGIQRSGLRINTPHFVLVVARTNDPESLPRLGITASKKVGNAVRRNRLKRIVRAAFQRLDGYVPNGHDLVVICKSDGPALGTDTVVQEWRRAEKRLNKVLAQSPSPGSNSDPREP